MKTFSTFLILCLLSLTALAQNAGLFQTYVIVNVNNGGNVYRAGNLNADNNPTTFNNVNLGTASTSIILNGGQVKTYKNNGGDVQGATMFYRVYRQGNTPGSYSSITLNFGQNYPTPGDQRWETNNSGVNLGALTTPGTYVLDVYFTISATGASLGTLSDGSAANPLKATFTATSTTLPVSFASFTAKTVNNRMARLDWTTATETTNAYFDVERSHDAQLFAQVGRVQGQGTTAARQTYQFVDEAPATGVNYYRLKQTDTDGKFTYSPVRAVIVGPDGELLVLGNPAADQVHVAGLEPGSSLELADLTGQVRSRQTTSQSEASVDVRHLPSGTYLLRVADPTGVQTRRILVNR